MENTTIWSPFHEGEIEVQTRVGVIDEVNQWAPHAIRPVMPAQHQSFFRQLPFVVAAARDNTGAPWATLLVGTPGFVQSQGPQYLEVRSKPLQGDALENSFFADAQIGLLGIELETRRRNRVNGKIAQCDEQGFTLAVEQSFGNCPQYISKRVWHKAGANLKRMQTSNHSRLDDHMKSWISRADTMFIASGHHEPHQKNGRGMDVSHRGGPAGFVKIKGDTSLVLPDYAGNNLFNTIGNLVKDSRVGLLFVEFQHGSMLQITGNAEIDWDSGEISKHPGAKRLINIEITHIVQSDHSLPLRWRAAEGGVRELVLVDKIIESEDVASFVFAPRDKGRLPLFKAGQYLPIELALEGSEVLERTYSLSNQPGEKEYRISVKREPFGLVSRLLHDHLSPGNAILAKAPEGGFVLPQDKDRPIVLVSAGIGITPMVSMLHVLAKQGRQVYFIHGARNGTHRPLVDEVAALAARHSDSVHLSVLYSHPHSKDIEGVDYHRSGRIDASALEQFVPETDAEFYVCGPKSFIADIVFLLTERGVTDEYIHIESFS
ncbi:pyridoxamine 5'-phosphate oxidase family protein [Desulfospira joergensenii]|uniref:FAD-binding oxidoreductase n=1 Tax=Desulfospira joergensenii TaxID=53329 RepID=UPI0003B77BDC|nr:pyridoxamine 5'-phosphate oxidase family protein [Desulfospira joergensenii]